MYSVRLKLNLWFFWLDFLNGLEFTWVLINTCLRPLHPIWRNRWCSIWTQLVHPIPRFFEVVYTCMWQTFVMLISIFLKKWTTLHLHMQLTCHFHFLHRRRNMAPFFAIEQHVFMVVIYCATGSSNQLQGLSRREFPTSLVSRGLVWYLIGQQ